MPTYAKRTFIDYAQGPFPVIRGAAAECPDGKVRKVVRISETADTFFSIPAAVKYKGVKVSGYVTVETVSGMTTPTPDDPTIVRFKPYTYGKHAAAFSNDVDGLAHALEQGAKP